LVLRATAAVVRPAQRLSAGTHVATAATNESRSDRSASRVSTTSSDALDELAVAAAQPRLLVGVDLADRRDPSDTRSRVVVEEEPAVQRYPPGQLQGGTVEDGQIDTGGEQHVERRRYRGGPPGRDVDVGVRPRRAGGPTAVQERKTGSGITQHSDDLPHQWGRNVDRHTDSLGDRRAAVPQLAENAPDRSARCRAVRYEQRAPAVGGRSCSSTTFRRLIDLAVERGGSYYLTCHRWADAHQVLVCYPQFADFLALKRHHDPDELFHTDWYQHHATMLSGAEASPCRTRT